MGLSRDDCRRLSDHNNLVENSSPLFFLPQFAAITFYQFKAGTRLSSSSSSSSLSSCPCFDIACNPSSLYGCCVCTVCIMSGSLYCNQSVNQSINPLNPTEHQNVVVGSCLSCYLTLLACVVQVLLLLLFPYPNLTCILLSDSQSLSSILLFL